MDVDAEKDILTMRELDRLRELFYETSTNINIAESSTVTPSSTPRETDLVPETPKPKVKVNVEQ
jgi:hypothetical protein